VTNLVSGLTLNEIPQFLGIEFVGWLAAVALPKKPDRWLPVLGSAVLPLASDKPLLAVRPERGQDRGQILGGDLVRLIDDQLFNQLAVLGMAFRRAMLAQVVVLAANADSGLAGRMLLVGRNSTTLCPRHDNLLALWLCPMFGTSH
jgi:hypothetical protein